MKAQRALSARTVTIGLVGWLIATDFLLWAVHISDFLPYKLIAFLCITLLSGFTVLRLLRPGLDSFTIRLIYAFGLGVLTLMISGLLANQLLQLVGVTRPLELRGIAGIWNVLTALLIIWGAKLDHGLTPLPKWPHISKASWGLVALSLALPCGAILGAYQLNNGGDGLVAMLTLTYAAALIVYALLLCRHTPDTVLAWFIFMLGLSLLLMTSMRGWDIVGHDVAHEFRVYNLAHLHGRWDIALLRDPYNACLSITILPEVLAKLLNISGIAVFKIVMQAIFATCPLVVYFLLRQYITRLGALTGSLLFTCYPTFINDSPMLVRQEVAYIFFALAIFIISRHTQSARHKLLFLFCALGVILSHYSTAYMFVALFGTAVVGKWCLGWWQKRKLSTPPETQHTVVSALFAILLLLMTFMWYTQVTGTSNGLVATVEQSLTSIPRLFSADSKSSDTSAALLFAGGNSQAGLYQAYLTHATPSSDQLAYEPQYMPQLTDDTLPLTTLGKRLQDIGFNPSSLTNWRQNYAKALQLFVLISVLFALYKWLRQHTNTLTTDFISLSLAATILLGLLVILPILSVNYGILRALQQALIFLLLPMTVLAVSLTRLLRSWMRTILAVTASSFIFLLFSGWLGQLLGGNSPTLTLNNAGLYYGLYYTSAADTQSFRWIKQHIPTRNDVRAASFNRALMHDPDYPFSTLGTLPTQVTSSSFVYLDAAQIHEHKLYTYYASSPLIMTFPLNYYDDNKNEIYSTNSTRVYH